MILQTESVQLLEENKGPGWKLQVSAGDHFSITFQFLCYIYISLMSWLDLLEDFKAVVESILNILDDELVENVGNYIESWNFEISKLKKKYESLRVQQRYTYVSISAMCTHLYCNGRDFSGIKLNDK
ncbi:hypothetical protein Droror1_Dr00025319 [Drosera rotundifolia]